jgi:hypothetical protein
MTKTSDVFHALYGIPKPESFMEKHAAVLPSEPKAEDTERYEERRENLAEILKAVERDGLSGPRDLDVALDAIEALFDVNTP